MAEISLLILVITSRLLVDYSVHIPAAIMHRRLCLSPAILWLLLMIATRSAEAACQACLFSIPFVAHRGHHRHHSGGGLGAQASSALVPFGIIAARQALTSGRRHSLIFRAENDEASSSSDDDKAEEKEEEPLLSSAAIGAIGFYKSFISPLLPPACRFVPTCSQYGVQAIQEFGTQKGVILIAWRLLRCSPVGGKGYDPPKWPPVAYNYASY